MRRREFILDVNCKVLDVRRRSPGSIESPLRGFRQGLKESG